MFTKNQDIKLKIDDMSAEGTGVGHCDGIAVFVQNTAVGDVIEAHILKAKKNYAVGKVNKIITASPDRVKPDCPVAGRCGGCCFRHISYEAELRAKQKRVQDAFMRIGHLDVTADPVAPSPHIDGYRNKAQYPVGTDTRDGSPLVGFYAWGSHRIVPCKNCKLQPSIFEDVVNFVTTWMTDHHVSTYDEFKKRGLLKHIYVRRAQFTGEVMVCLVINGEHIPNEKELIDELVSGIPGFKTFVLNINKEDTNVILGGACKILFGDGYINDTLLGCKFRISPLSFYQVNSEQCENLYTKAAEFAALTGDETVLDLYCGTGTIGLTMAKKVKRLIGVEIIPQAVEDAKKNAAANGFTNTEFYCGDAALIADKLASEGATPDVILIDPPRKGMDKLLIATVDKMNPSRVVYISCDPATLARDCAEFTSLGWTISRVAPFDMFPHTAHVETVVLLSKVQK